MNKEHKVISKYKNPDKYIETLKTKLKFAQDISDDWRNDWHKKNQEYNELEENAYGKHWANYSDNKIDSWITNESSLNGINLEDEVWIKANICEITRTNIPNQKCELKYKKSKVYIKRSGN